MDSLYDITNLTLTPNATARQKREHWRASLTEKSRQQSTKTAMEVDSKTNAFHIPQLLPLKHIDSLISNKEISPINHLQNNLISEKKNVPVMKKMTAVESSVELSSESNAFDHPIIKTAVQTATIESQKENKQTDNKNNNLGSNNKDKNNNDKDIKTEEKAEKITKTITSKTETEDKNEKSVLPTLSVDDSTSVLTTPSAKSPISENSVDSSSSSPESSKDSLSSQQIESEFQNLSLAFRTDNATVHERAKLIQHQQSIADEDVRLEMAELKSQIMSLKSLIIDTSYANGPRTVSAVSKLALQSEIVEDAFNRLVLKSELAGSLSYELKMTEAFRVAQMHVDNLKRAKERDERELDDFKRLLCLPGEQHGGGLNKEKAAGFWLNQEKPLDQFEENILKLASNSGTPISAATSKINFIRLRRASVASMDFQSKEITRRSRVFKPELKILRQSDSSFDSPDIKSDHQAFIESFNRNCNKKTQINSVNNDNSKNNLSDKKKGEKSENCDEDDNKTTNTDSKTDSETEDCHSPSKPLIMPSKTSPSKKFLNKNDENCNNMSNIKEYGNNLKELCKKYRDKLTETWIEEEKDDVNCSECCENSCHLQSTGSATNEFLASNCCSAAGGCREEKCGKGNSLWIPKFVFWVLKGMFDFVIEKNRFCITELIKLVENIDTISAQEDFVQLRYLIAAFLIFVSFMLFLWNILLPSMI